MIAHSLGTVVTYEALHAHPDLEVDLLVTLGSPLAGADYQNMAPLLTRRIGRPQTVSGMTEPVF